MSIRNGTRPPPKGIPLTYGRPAFSMPSSGQSYPPGPSSAYADHGRLSPPRPPHIYGERYTKDIRYDDWRERNYYSTPSPEPRYSWGRFQDHSQRGDQFLPVDPNVAPWPDFHPTDEVNLVSHRTNGVIEKPLAPNFRPLRPERNHLHDHPPEGIERDLGYPPATRHGYFPPPRRNEERAEYRATLPNAQHRARYLSPGSRMDSYRPQNPWWQHETYEDHQRRRSHPSRDYSYRTSERSFTDRERSASYTSLSSLPRTPSVNTLSAPHLESNARTTSRFQPPFFRSSIKEESVPMVYDSRTPLKKSQSDPQPFPRISPSSSVDSLEEPAVHGVMDTAQDHSDSVASTPHHDASSDAQLVSQSDTDKQPSAIPPLQSLKAANYVFKIGNRITRFVPAGAIINETPPLAAPGIIDNFHSEQNPDQSSRLIQDLDTLVKPPIEPPIRTSSPELSFPAPSLDRNLSITIGVPGSPQSTTARSGTGWESDMEMSSPTSPASPIKTQISQSVQSALDSSPKRPTVLSPALSSISFREETLVRESDRETSLDDSDMEMSPPPTPNKFLPESQDFAAKSQEEISSWQTDELYDLQERHEDTDTQSRRSPVQLEIITEKKDIDDDNSDMDVSLPPTPERETAISDTQDDSDLYGRASPQTFSIPVSTSSPHQSQAISSTLFDDDLIPGLTISARVKGTSPVPSLSTPDVPPESSTLVVFPQSPVLLTPDIEPLKSKAVPWEWQQADVGNTPPPSVRDTDHDEGETLPDLSVTEAAAADVGMNVTADDVALVEEPLSESLRIVVMMRLKCDHQPREARVEPVLLANQLVAEPESLRRSSSPDPPSSLDDIFSAASQKLCSEAGGAVINPTKTSLEQRFKQRQADLNDKVQRLKEEYLTLHRRWMAHCAKLDEVVKANALEEAAATAGRTTRRSTTGLGDAVRSDLEMEQIIASLGNEEMTDANHLALRNVADIPDMLSVIRSKVDYLYDDTNNLVEDPPEFYAPRTGMDDWTEDEQAIFLAKFVEKPKQFGLIADALPNKTAAQCVLYYYLHKRTVIDFHKAITRQQAGKRKRGGGRRGAKQKGNALLTDIRKRDDEVSRDGPTTRRRRAPPQAQSDVVTAAEPKKSAVSRRATVQRTAAETPSATPEPEPDSRRRRRRAMPAARVTTNPEQGEGEEDLEDAKPAKRARRTRKVKQPEITVVPITYEEFTPAPGETRFIDQTDFTSKRKSSQGNASWSEEDKALFLTLLAQHGDDFKRIAASMPNKTTIQVSVFYKANLAEMNLQRVAASAPKRSPTPDVAFAPSSAAPFSATASHSGDSMHMWKETNYPYTGSGVVTPSTALSTTPTPTPTPSEGAMEAGGGGEMRRFKFDEHVAAPRKIHIQDMNITPSHGHSRPGREQEMKSREEVSSNGSASSSSSSSSSSSPRGTSMGYRFRATTAESIVRASYGSNDRLLPPLPLPHPSMMERSYPAHPPANPSRTQPITPVNVNNPNVPISSFSHQSQHNGFGREPPAGPLTMTFPSSFAYSNLSPSHFALQDEHSAHPRPHSRHSYPHPRHPHPSSPHSNLHHSRHRDSDRMAATFDNAVLPRHGSSYVHSRTPPRWTDVPPHAYRDGRLNSHSQYHRSSHEDESDRRKHQDGRNNMPASLQTTDDLVAYLEHRTRSVVGRRRDDDNVDDDFM